MVRAPIGYVTPKFPALFWPTSSSFDHAYLYHTRDIWLFTALWGMILSIGVYLIASLWILITHFPRKHNRRRVVAISLAYVSWGALNGFISGSLIGLLIAALYNASQFRLTPWIPFVWGLIIVIYTILSSYKFYISII